MDNETVVVTAAELADRDGLDSLTLTKVAKELGISQPALYRHVDGYDDLIRSLGLRGRQVLADALTSAAVGLAGQDALRAMGNAWREIVRLHPGLYAATDRYPCADDPELEEAVERIVHVLSQGLASFELTEDDRVHAARSLRSAFHGFAHLESGDGHPRPHDVDDTFEHMVELLSCGFRALPTAKTP